LRQTKTSIKAVTFDLWETLLFEKDGWNQRRTNARCQNLAQTLSRLGVRIPAEQFVFAFKEMTSWLENIWEDNREVTNYDQVQFIIKTASKNRVSLKQKWINQLSLAYISAIFDVPPILNPDASKVLQLLRDQNKRVGIICNTGITPGFGLRKVLTDMQVADYFDLMLFSDEVGVRKPNVEIFKIAAQKLHTEPHNIVHVGDNIKSDVWGAQNAGFRAILLETTTGRDRTAETDPTSLVSISRKMGSLKKEQIIPDKTVTSLAATIKAIQELEA
jgi:putative hydrolase of the HAD superfamily